MTRADPSQALETLLPADNSAHALRAHLDEYVIGQEDAKIALSLIFSMHLRWFAQRERLHKAPNALLVGPTGVGKTHTLKTAAEFLRLPVALVDTTSLVPSGAVGIKVEDILADLVAAAGAILDETSVERFEDDDIALASRGVVFLDEFDKIRDEGTATNIAAWNRTTQRRLLKLTEGSVMKIGGGNSMFASGGDRTLDTSGLLIIAGGAFAGIDHLSIRSARADTMTRALRPGNEIIAHDIVNYGFIPELVARLAIIVSFMNLDGRTLLRILRSPAVTPLGVWENHFAQFGKRLVVEQQALVEVAKRAAALEMGARGLQQVLFPLLASLAYDFETSAEESLVITASMVRGE